MLGRLERGGKMDGSVALRRGLLEGDADWKFQGDRLQGQATWLRLCVANDVFCFVFRVVNGQTWHHCMVNAQACLRVVCRRSKSSRGPCFAGAWLVTVCCGVSKSWGGVGKLAGKNLLRACPADSGRHRARLS